MKVSAVRMVRAHQQDYPAMTPVAGAVAKQLGPCSALGNQDSPAAPADDQPSGALGETADSDRARQRRV